MTYLEAENRIKDLVDEGFLDKLAEIGRLYGWQGDYVEIKEFINTLHLHYGINDVDLEPYNLDDDI